MFAAFPATVLLLADAPPSPAKLVMPRELHGAVGFARASGALGYAADGSAADTGANIPRFTRAGGLWIEEARGNAVRNPRAIGAIAGTPGTLPTNWNLSRVTGLTSGIGTPGAEDGLPYLELVFSGGSGSSNTYLGFETGGIACTAGVPITMSVSVRLSAGTLANASLLHFITWRNASGTTLSTSQLAFTPTAASLADQRFTFTATPPANATSALASLRISLSAAVSFSVQVAAPQVEQGSFATSPMLPPAGTIAATARALDEATYTLPRAATAGTVVLQASLPRLAGQTQGLCQWDAGGGTDRIALLAEDGILRARIDRDGTPATVLALGSVPGGGPFRAVLGWGAGGISCCMTGGALQSGTGASPAAPTRVLVGRTIGGSVVALNGALLNLDLYGTRLADAQIQALAQE